MAEIISNVRNSCICKEKIENKIAKDKKYCTIGIIQENTEVLPIGYAI